MASIRETLDRLKQEIATVEPKVKSIREEITQSRNHLEECTRKVKLFETQAVGGALPPAIYGQYDQTVNDCNVLVKTHNKRVESYKLIQAEYGAKIDEHNALVPSFNELAAAAGTRWYLIPGLGRRSHTASHVSRHNNIH